MIILIFIFQRTIADSGDPYEHILPTAQTLPIVFKACMWLTV